MHYYTSCNSVAAEMWLPRTGSFTSNNFSKKETSVIALVLRVELIITMIVYEQRFSNCKFLYNILCAVAEKFSRCCVLIQKFICQKKCHAVFACYLEALMVWHNYNGSDAFLLLVPPLVKGNKEHSRCMIRDDEAIELGKELKLFFDGEGVWADGDFVITWVLEWWERN